VNKLFNSLIFIIFFLISNCSLNNPGGFWTKQQDLSSNQSEFEVLFKKDQELSNEFNKEFLLNIKSSQLKKNNLSYLDNNDGYKPFQNSLEKVSKYKFSKIKNFESIEANLVFHKNNIIFFDNKGSIINYSDDGDLVWKSNIYTKAEKKNQPLISLVKYDNFLIAADDLGKIYSLDINNGEILWIKENTSPFNSELKFLDNYIFIVDANNTLNCFSLNDGNKVWARNTEKPFISSSKKLSLVVRDKSIIFSNSIGDITSVDADTGTLSWLRSTRNSIVFEEVLNLKTSDIVLNENSIYFSNNKGDFYSIDVNSGAVNWKQNISSDIKPIIIGNLIFTISLDGYLFLIEKNTGNILRITNVINKSIVNKNKKFIPTGFILNSENIYISTNQGLLIIADIKTGQNLKFYKVNKEKISRAFINNDSMYLIQDDSILKLD